MRFHLGLLVIGSVALVACGSEDSGGIRRGPSTSRETTPGAGDTSVTPGSAPGAGACPTGVPEAKALSTTDTNARNVRIVSSGVIFQDGTRVLKVDTQTNVRTSLYESPDLVSSFADETVLVTIESPNAPDAVLKVMPAGQTTGEKPALPLTATLANWNAGGTYVFASDATSFYVLADVANQGDTIYKVSKADPNTMTELASLNAPLGDPQLAGNDIWFVREQKRVYKVAQTVEDPAGPGDVLGEKETTAEPATEIFGIGYADCKLAVGGSHAFCSTGKSLEQRDLKGGNMTTVFDSQKGAAPTLLGSAIYGTDTVFVRSLPATATDALKSGIRAVSGTTEKFVACGRDPINSFAVGPTTVAWAEQGKGVFLAPR